MLDGEWHTVGSASLRARHRAQLRVGENGGFLGAALIGWARISGAVAIDGDGDGSSPAFPVRCASEPQPLALDSLENYNFLCASGPVGHPAVLPSPCLGTFASGVPFVRVVGVVARRLGGGSRGKQELALPLLLLLTEVQSTE